LSPRDATAAATMIDPSAQIGTLPEAGAPSFVFNGGAGSFGGTIQSWYENYVYIQNTGGAAGTYTLYAHNEGAFTFWGDPTTSYAGTSGDFNLMANFDSAGTFLDGWVTINGAITDIGITDPTTQLMTGDLTRFDFAGDLLGFGMDITYCDPAIDAFGCTAVEESIYFGLADVFPGIAALNGMDYQSTMINKTTVPVPASAWLMISGLGWLAVVARRRRATDQ